MLDNMEDMETTMGDMETIMVMKIGMQAMEHTANTVFIMDFRNFNKVLCSKTAWTGI